MKFKIYQIKNMRETAYCFRGWDFAKNHSFTIGDYEEVYAGERDKKHILSNLWEEFNIDHPADFRGHSLSVSDIVALKEKDFWYWYYCDSFGWEDITDIVD